MSGTELLAALDGSAGDRNGDSSNVYVNIDFSLAEQFDRMVVTTTGIAGEFDNIVVGVTGQPIGQVSVPAPATALLFILGLAGVGAARRFKK